MAVGAVGPGFGANGVAIDTRLLAPGDLFVALQGERDGHDFVAEAFAKGAAGALVSRDVAAAGPVLRVDDTLAALTRLAEFARARARAKIVAVTGSVGKTTTKEMLRRALGAFGAVHAAEASFNNHIGVPLTLARLPPDAAFAVLEIGMNHPGEIAPLARLARPHVAIVTNVERTHLGLMGSEAAIAAEKSTISLGLTQGGVALLPADSPHLKQLARNVPLGARMLRFGAGPEADVRLLEAASDAEGCDVTGRVAGLTVRFRLNAPGRHMASNAMAVLAACHALGLDAGLASQALDKFEPVAGRGLRRQIKAADGAVILLDESYNASGASMRAAFSVLALQPGRRVAVLGDMLELGDEAVAEHISLHDPLSEAADLIFTAGPMMARLFDTLSPARQGAHMQDAAALAPIVKAALRGGDAVLVKGSYGSRMRDVVSILDSSA
jgi:UDP-N-acetylmuramoyl-tripeptide--D-alanyl-D-alanine ligase